MTAKAGIPIKWHEIPDISVFQRKANIAEREREQMAADPVPGIDAPATPQPRNWAASVQPKIAGAAGRSADKR